MGDASDVPSIDDNDISTEVSIIAEGSPRQVQAVPDCSGKPCGITRKTVPT